MSAAGAIRIRVAGVYTRGDEILLVNHVKDGRSYWLLPGGGLEFGESFAQGLERELTEECGIKTATGALILVAESLPPDRHRHVVNRSDLLRFRLRIMAALPIKFPCTGRGQGIGWRRANRRKHDGDRQTNSKSKQKVVHTSVISTFDAAPNSTTYLRWRELFTLLVCWR